MTHWKGEDLIRAKPNEQGLHGRAHPYGGSMTKRRGNEPCKCAVPGCDRTLGTGNKHGVCKIHPHFHGVCRCAVCVAKWEKNDG